VTKTLQIRRAMFGIWLWRNRAKEKFEWANQQMPVLQLIRKRFIKERR